MPIVFYANPVDLQVVRISEPLPTNVQPPLMEEKSLLNQEALDSMTHAGLDKEVVDAAILAESTEKDCALANGSNIVLEVIQEEEEQVLPIVQVDTDSGEEDDIILPSLKLHRVQPPLFKVKPISLIPSSPLATPSIIIGTFESSLYQPPPPPNLHFIPSPTPTRHPKP